MTLLTTMYHRASVGPYGNAADMLDAHFKLIAEKYHCVLPGEPLDPQRLNVCLTFDDAFYDFYAVVFPLLQKHGLRALLAVPVGLIQQHSLSTPQQRLELSAHRGADGQNPDGYCTWVELVEMARTPTVAMAAHGFTHTRLDQPDCDLHTEFILPQTILAGRTQKPVESFVMPYGRFSADTLAFAKRHYRYVFRIGNADNAGWGGRVLYRVNADEIGAPDAVFGHRHRLGYRVRRHWNALRAR